MIFFERRFVFINIYFYFDIFYMDNEEYISMYNYLFLLCYIKKYKLEFVMYNEQRKQKVYVFY